MNKLPVVLRLLAVVWLVLFVASVSRPFVTASKNVILNHHHGPPWPPLGAGSISASPSSADSPLPSSTLWLTFSNHQTIRSHVHGLVRNASETREHVLNRLTILLSRPKFNSLRRLIRSAVLYIRNQSPTHTTPPAACIPPTRTVGAEHPASPIPGHAWRGRLIFSYTGTAHLKQLRQCTQALPRSLKVVSYLRGVSQKVNLDLLAKFIGAVLVLLLGLGLSDHYDSDAESYGTHSGSGSQAPRWVDMVLVDVEIAVRLQSPKSLTPPTLYTSSGFVTRELDPSCTHSEMMEWLLGAIINRELASLEGFRSHLRGAKVEVVIDVLAGPYSAYINQDGTEHRYNDRTESSRKMYTIDLSTRARRSNVGVSRSITGVTHAVVRRVGLCPSITYFKPPLGRIGFSDPGTTIVGLLMIPNAVFIGLMVGTGYFTPGRAIVTMPQHGQLIGWKTQEKLTHGTHTALNIEPLVNPGARPERLVPPGHPPRHSLGFQDSLRGFEEPRAEREARGTQRTLERLERFEGGRGKEGEGEVGGPERPKENKRGGVRVRKRAARRAERAQATKGHVPGMQVGDEVGNNSSATGESHSRAGDLATIALANLALITSATPGPNRAAGPSTAGVGGLSQRQVS